VLKVPLSLNEPTNLSTCCTTWLDKWTRSAGTVVEVLVLAVAVAVV